MAEELRMVERFDRAHDAEPGRREAVLAVEQRMFKAAEELTACVVALRFSYECKDETKGLDEALAAIVECRMALMRRFCR